MCITCPICPMCQLSHVTACAPCDCVSPKSLACLVPAPKNRVSLSLPGTQCRNAGHGLLCKDGDQTSAAFSSNRSLRHKQQATTHHNGLQSEASRLQQQRQRVQWGGECSQASQNASCTLRSHPKSLILLVHSIAHQRKQAEGIKHETKHETDTERGRHTRYIPQVTPPSPTHAMHASSHMHAVHLSMLREHQQVSKVASCPFDSLCNST
jgi:hypothetical protein